MKLTSCSLSQTLDIGKRISRHLEAADIICLYGELGSGKTALTKGIALGLGIKSSGVISPSFVLLRQYTEGRLPLYHFDLYRLKEPKEILGLGYEEYLYSDGAAVVEWADRLGPLLPEEFLKVELSFKTESQRVLNFFAIGGRYIKLLKEIHEDIRH
jgi:tRNA threonylcarbamoyladenosine biosynthesis protein TsaE